MNNVNAIDMEMVAEEGKILFNGAIIDIDDNCTCKCQFVTGSDTGLSGILAYAEWAGMSNPAIVCIPNREGIYIAYKPSKHERKLIEKLRAAGRRVYIVDGSAAGQYIIHISH